MCRRIYDLSITLTEREDLIDKLEENCLHLHEPPPLYTVLSETGRSNEPYFAVKCEAMGYIAVGKLYNEKKKKKSKLEPYLQERIPKNTPRTYVQFF